MDSRLTVFAVLVASTLAGVARGAASSVVFGYNYQAGSIDHNFTGALADTAVAPALVFGPAADTGYGPEYRFTRAVVLESCGSSCESNWTIALDRPADARVNGKPWARVLVVERIASPDTSWQSWLASAQARGDSDGFTLAIGSPSARIYFTDVRPRSIREYITRDASGQEQLVEQMTLLFRGAAGGVNNYGINEDASLDFRQANIRHSDLVKFTEYEDVAMMTYQKIEWTWNDGSRSHEPFDAGGARVQQETMQNLQENVETATRLSVFQFNLKKSVRDAWPSGR